MSMKRLRYNQRKGTRIHGHGSDLCGTATGCKVAVANRGCSSVFHYRKHEGVKRTLSKEEVWQV